MAALTWYLLDALAGTSDHLSLQDDGGSAPSDATTGTGWTYGTTAADNYSRMNSQTERTALTFSTTAQPSGGPDNSLGDCFRTQSTLDGTFASGNFDIAIPVIAVSASGTHDGLLRIRVWRDTNEDGSTATEITSSTQETTAFTNLSSAGAQTLTLAWDPGGVTLTNEYLFLQVATRVTGAGGMSTNDVLVRVGSASRVITPDFTPAGGTTFTRSYSELAGLIDAFQRTSVANRVYSDSGGLQDAFARISTANRVYAESTGLQDAFARLSAANRAYSDNAGLTDAILRLSFANRLYADTAGLADAFARLASANRALAETTGLTDTFSRVSGANRVYTDPLGLADTILRLSAANRVYADALGLADAFSRIASGNRLFADSAGLADAATLTTTIVFALALAESLGVVDAYARTSDAARSFADSLGSTDAFFRSVQIFLVLSESLGLSEAYARQANASRALAESLGFAEAYARVASASRAFADILGILDSLLVEAGMAMDIMMDLEEVPRRRADEGCEIRTRAVDCANER